MDKSMVHIVSIISAAFALCISAAASAMSQGNATARAVDGIARQPEAKAPITQALIVGLAFMESLTLYVLLIAIVLVFVNPFK